MVYLFIYRQEIHGYFNIFSLYHNIKPNPGKSARTVITKYDCNWKLIFGFAVIHSTPSHIPQHTTTAAMSITSFHQINSVLVGMHIDMLNTSCKHLAEI